MGIPHLLALLEPYGQPADFATPPPRTQTLVIDGPALAFAAYQQSLAQRARAEHALEAIPPYDEVCVTAVACLDILEHHGLEM